MRSQITLLLFAFLYSCDGPTRGSDPVQQVTHLADTRTHPDSMAAKEGIIFFSTNNGLSWENRSNGLPDTARLGLGAIAVSDISLAIATKDNGVYIFDFERNVWTKIPTDRNVIESNPAAIIFHKDGIYVGTQFRGVFFTADHGKNWGNVNTGLGNLTIRRFTKIDNKLYAGTNAGIYSYDEVQNKWRLEYGNNTLQVNGITEFNGSIYIGTNRGVFKTPKSMNDWKQVMIDKSLHNISSDDQVIYAMVYNELFSSVNGEDWRTIQTGLPAQLYTFNVLKNGNEVFAAQWDGVYKRDIASGHWQHYSKGLPARFAVVNMKVYKGIIVASGSERKLKAGLTSNK